MFKKFLFAVLLLVVSVQFSSADSIAINQFEVKDNPFGNNQIAIVATDTAKNILTDVNGTFSFTINGFEHALTFNKGVAFFDPKIDKSIFLYVKHVNDSGSHSMLYYVFKHDDKLSPIRISWMLLLAIPLSLILLGYLFKRFIIIAAVIFIFFIYFNHHSGLGISTFFESILDGMKHIFK